MSTFGHFQQQAQILMPKRRLADGNEMPVLGFGTWLFPEKDVYGQVKKAVM